MLEDGDRPGQARLSSRWITARTRQHAVLTNVRGPGPCGRAEAFLKISLKESGTEKGAAGDEAEAGSADTQAAAQAFMLPLHPALKHSGLKKPTAAVSGRTFAFSLELTMDGITED